MKHISHIQKNKKHLNARFEITKLIREFFWSMNFTEVETPNILKLPGQEPYLSPMKMSVQDEKGKTHTGYLHTSPEYTMKKMLAAGYENIFSICKCYRNNESFGGSHNPEFTMIEWYRTGEDMFTIMNDVENLFGFLYEKISVDNFQLSLSNFQRKSMKEIWEEYIEIDLDAYLTRADLFNLCKERGYKPGEDEPYEDLFYRIFLNEIEPKMKDQNFFIHHYPAQLAALAKLSEKNSKYAERFEVYVDGVELANAFTELTNAEEQNKRLEKERLQRKILGKDVFDIDAEFIAAVENLPPCAGIALGVDRLVQILTGCQNIDDVLVLPMSQIFKT